ncbi:EutN/CcmL family microcompartment protein [Cerasicoccus maritimus]|uniref:EutN/CcmL family microcompartment protein n=1 Tax=Cerasicoccus maritimus TaxID=490089 RepID=UPI002852CDD0|nr:EutN/CcmL family microcompartment protein [Cerasicoccus maritimus]
MRFGKVIGKVTLSDSDPSYKGGRFLLVSPMDKARISGEDLPPVSGLPDVVVYDNVGGGLGDTIGFVEGGEASATFDQPTPVDAFNCALIDEISYQGKTHSL